jgi:hypothetical protein
MKSSSITLFLYLAVGGTILSVLSLILPWLGIDPNLISSSGQISSGLAAAFGLAVAAIALKSYVWSESTERQDIDSVWGSIRTLQKEAFYASLITTVINKNMIRAESKDREEIVKEAFQAEALKSMNKALDTSLTPEFVKWVELGNNGENIKLSFFRLKLGFKLAELNEWHCNELINQHIVEICEYVKPLTHDFVKNTYRLK